MKRIIRLLLCLGVLCAFIAASPITAGAQSGTEGFYITKYDVNAVISDTNVYDITETINVHFTEAKHGIIRDIPVNTVMKRDAPNEPSTKVSSSVWGVNVEGNIFSVQNDPNWVYIQIGDPNQTVTGDVTYKISYKMGFGNDGVQAFDEAYYNIIGVDWPCTIDNVTFSVTLPKVFDVNKLGFDTGTFASFGYDPSVFKFQINGNTITGQLQKELGTYEGVTMRLELPQGYFNVPDLRLPDWIIMGVMGALVLLSIILFLIFGRDKKPVQTVEFYAPEGLTPSEVGYIIDGNVDDRDVVSLIVYWADKGYLSISDKGKQVFELKKLKELGKDAKGFEKRMFDGLFKDGETVDTNDLHFSFYPTYESVKSMIKMSFESESRRVYTRQSTRLMPLFTFFTAIPAMLAIILSISRDDTGLFFALAIGAMIGIALLLPSFYLIGLLRRWRGETKRAPKLIFGIIFWAVLTAIILYIASTNAYEPLLPWAAIVATVIIGLCAVFIRKRTQKGTEWMGKILGLKNFIQVAEKERINLLVKENPSYFYNVLPYAYVLGVSDKWIKNFESITVQPPNWYYGQGTFTPMLFMGSFYLAMNTFRTQMVSTPPSTGRSGFGGFSGGGFGGGGFSGGGGGGGGGHSW